MEYIKHWPNSFRSWGHPVVSDPFVYSIMANDREVLRLIWDGKIPICFVADPGEIVGMVNPEPMFLMVSHTRRFP